MIWAEPATHLTTQLGPNTTRIPKIRSWVPALYLINSLLDPWSNTEPLITSFSLPNSSVLTSWSNQPYSVRPKRDHPPRTQVLPPHHLIRPSKTRPHQPCWRLPPRHNPRWCRTRQHIWCGFQLPLFRYLGDHQQLLSARPPHCCFLAAYLNGFSRLVGWDSPAIRPHNPPASAVWSLVQICIRGGCLQLFNELV